jgi:beta-barrel assembly-enhancing protease
LSAAIPVWHYDGQVAVRHQALLMADGDGFRVTGPGLTGDFVKWAELVYRDAQGKDLVYGLKGRTGWQIGVNAEQAADLGARLPRKHNYGGLIDRFGLVPGIVTLFGISAAAIFGIMQVPQIVAPLVPFSWEKKLGDAMVGDLGGRICNTRESREALDAMVARLNPRGVDIRVDIANIGMVNAVALPGGRIVIFKHLLQEAKSPEELAGVLGHEIGHVGNRDVMQSLLRQLGLSVVLGGANSNAAGALNALIASGYSREAEAAADDYSIKLMQDSKVSPVATADFFNRLAEMEKELGRAAAVVGYISSHPLSSERAQTYRESAIKGAAHRSVVTPRQWLAIVDACSKDPDVKQDDGLFL